MSTRPQSEGAEEYPPPSDLSTAKASPDRGLLSEMDIAALRHFFALLDEWDQEEQHCQEQMNLDTLRALW
jgi:hypothetical protein